jgi:hypothetical protein
MSHASVIFREQKIGSNGSTIFNSKKQFQLEFTEGFYNCGSCRARGLTKGSSTVAGSDDAPSE